ncbi:hypothetical protein PENTCL1PPCAC_4268 [Pristionchus entomophagus]|uniref:Succinate dehydrogenase assembly factor 2, mitochondrial n=1 Tax=Pristionchus entomophagus TaxID=358040 RepID=A0AAV5SNC3_9BILA|nr:hypothetical protein PENTCL1PPCAC_4268 [Pristionchus entomophagus]
MLRRVTVALSRCMPSASSGVRTLASGPPPRVAQVDTDLATKRARLLYQSKKRGILENDILLGQFAESHLGLMDSTTLEEYDKMINGDHMEWDLFYYLSGKKPAPPEVESTHAFALLKKFVDAKKEPISR